MSHCNVRLPRWYHWISFAVHAWKDKATEKPTTKSYCWELGTCTANSYVHHEPWSLCTLALAKDSICPSNHRKVVLCFVGMFHPTSAHYLNSNLTWNPHKNENGRLVHEQVFLWFRVLLGMIGFCELPLWYPMIIEGSSWVLPLFEA